MKKRHEQKLVILSLALFVVFNVPVILIFNATNSVFGVPVLYFSIFIFCLVSIIASFIILKRYYE